MTETTTTTKKTGEKALEYEDFGVGRRRRRRVLLRASRAARQREWVPRLIEFTVRASCNECRLQFLLGFSSHSSQLTRKNNNSTTTYYYY